MLIKKALEFVCECLKSDNSGHDIEHIKRVVENAKLIIKGEKGADYDVVILAAILHDVDDYKLRGSGDNLEKFFKINNVDEKLREKIRVVVESISFSKSGDNPNFEMIEQKIVSDADKLDAMGAVGVCRTILYSASTNRALFNNEELPKENLTKEEYKDKNRKGNHSVNHFFDKLLKLKGAMQTEAGRIEAQKRHDFMVEFLSEFFREVGAKEEWYNILEKNK